MISKAKSIKGSSQSIDYILNDKGQAVELDRSGVVGVNGKEILSEFRMVQAENHHCKNNTMSIVLSPDSEQGKYNIDQLKEFLYKHLYNLGLRNHQWIASVHNSTDNQHIHIIANRIDSNGKALNDSFISKKAQESAESIAKEYGLVTAQSKSLEMVSDTKALRKSINRDIIECKGHSKTFQEFCDLMKDKGHEIKPSINGNGAMFGMRIESHGHSFKLSEINRKIKHIHFAYILPKDTLLKDASLKKTIPTNTNLIGNAISNQLKQSLGKEVQDVFKAIEVASTLNPTKLAVNASKQVVKSLKTDMGMSM